MMGRIQSKKDEIFFNMYLQAIHVDFANRENVHLV